VDGPISKYPDTEKTLKKMSSTSERLMLKTLKWEADAMESSFSSVMKLQQSYRAYLIKTKEAAAGCPKMRDLYLMLQIEYVYIVCCYGGFATKLTEMQQRAAYRKWSTALKSVFKLRLRFARTLAHLLSIVDKLRRDQLLVVGDQSPEFQAYKNCQTHQDGRVLIPAMELARNYFSKS
jgi:hypothetical protein